MSRLTKRQQAEAIEKFGDDLTALLKGFCVGFDLDVTDRVCAVPNQEHLDCIAEAFQLLGDQMQAECDEAEDAETLARANPLEPGFRRLDR